MVTSAQEFQKATGVSRETLSAFEDWYARLSAANAHTNLVGRSTLGEFWSRHALDGFQLIDLAPGDGKNWLDFGAGAGIPGLAIALGMRDRQWAGAHVTFVESIGKKARFISECVDALALKAEVHNARVEALPQINKFEVITARAVAALPKLLTYAYPLLKSAGICLFPKGERYRQELTDARKYWTFEEEIHPSRTSDAGVILRLRNIKPRKG
ncbi:16S rRNA (guanine(527)-N(7))-methyltransferase RsmG [Hyphobacterium sp.]|uniref:16S rRNA (guanine(527)-N(7))-methyltransferase RsmG n=1 Tax=Hyphobacterium sp. TaxID=2004662 RepID=UPI003BA85246